MKFRNVLCPVLSEFTQVACLKATYIMTIQVLNGNSKSQIVTNWILTFPPRLTLYAAWSFDYSQVKQQCYIIHSTSRS
jgi:hypothetical protein